ARQRADLDRLDDRGRGVAERDRAVALDRAGAARRGAGLDLTLEDVVRQRAELNRAADVPRERAHLPTDGRVRVAAAGGHVRLELAVELVAGEQIDGAAVDGDVGAAGLDLDLGRRQRAGD